jgi:hypothetical protein
MMWQQKQSFMPMYLHKNLSDLSGAQNQPD